MQILHLPLEDLVLASNKDYLLEEMNHHPGLCLYDIIIES